MYQSRPKAVPSRTKRSKAHSLLDRPGGEKRHGKGITDAWLAEQLQPYGIRPRMMRIGQAQARGYYEEDFQEAFQRYMSRSDMEALRASLQARQAIEEPKTSGQKTQAGNPNPDARDEKATASDSTPEDQKPDEPGEMAGGEAAAA